MSGRGRGRGGYGGAGRGRGGQGVGQQSASFHPQGRGAGGRGNEQSYGYRALTPVVASSSTVPTMQSRELQNVSFGSAAEGSSRTFASGSVQPQPATQRPPVQVPAGSSVGRGQGRGGAQSSPVGGIAGGSTAVPSVASSSTDLTPSGELKNLSLGSAAPAAVGTTVASALVQPQQSMQQRTAQPDLSVSTQQSNVGSGSEAVPLVPSSSKLHKAPARPGYGTAGKKCVIKANHFCVEFGDKDPYQYDVTITPEVTSKTKCRDIMKCLIKDYRVSHMGNRPLAYDGKKSAFVAGPLPFESKDFVIVVPEKDGRQREFKVAIKFAAKKDLHHLREFLSGTQLDNPQETIQALDVVLREAASKGREIVGRSIFSTAFGKGSLGNGIEYWRGFYQSLRPTQMGLSLNIDMSARAFYDSILVSDFVMAYLAKDVTRPLSDQERIRVKKALRGVRVRVTHGGFNRSYKVHSITTQTTSQLTFPIDESGTVISVIQYFRDKYNFTLQFPFLPAIQAGTDAKPTYLPMEICSLVDGQRYSKKLNERQVTQMLRATCKRPNERENEIKTVRRGNNYANDELVKDFGLQVREQLTSIEARVLPPPPLKYHESGRKSEVYPSVGQWNMMDLKMINGGTVNFWAVVNFSRHRQNAVDNFRDGLISMCIEKGMVFDRQPLIPTFNASPQSIEKVLVDVHNQCCAQLARTSCGHFQLLFVILPEISGSYGKLLITQSLNLEKIRREGKIKRICETELGIVSQCCQPKHVMKPNRQYFENVALKINVKVGGRNTILSATLNKMLPMVTDRPTIIFGADVTHPQPGEDSGPSIAAVVASMDWPYVTKYRALMSAQPHRQEIIEDLYTTYTDAQRGLVHAGLIRDHLIAFKNATGHKPHRIIFYRDGVSEGQFSHVLLHEMDKIRKACVSLEENYLPRVTFIVVQKRHHTRLFPANHGDRQTTDRSGNILPGTVVDTNICHPTEFDFYLCSHAGIQGTSRPTHYHVLYDENKFTADGLQTLTNSLCYTYARCTRSVSIVPPAYYAHLTAFRARYYTEGMASESESAAGGRATRERTAEVRQLPMIRDNVKAVMFYC